MNKKATGLDSHIARTIRLRREQLGMNQRTLGDKLGVTAQQISKRERCIDLLNQETLDRTAKALNVPVTYFYEGYEGE